jgi:hypothetical protein
MNFKIFVLDNRFVYIGEGEVFECPLLGKSLRIKNAYNIRRWGTKGKGLGYLAIEGKQSETILGYCGIVDVAINRVAHIINVTEKAKKTFYEN